MKINYLLVAVIAVIAIVAVVLAFSFNLIPTDTKEKVEIKTESSAIQGAQNVSKSLESVGSNLKELEGGLP